jgi:hypothetical protein
MPVCSAAPGAVSGSPRSGIDKADISLSMAILRVCVLAHSSISLSNSMLSLACANCSDRLQSRLVDRLKLIIKGPRLSA